MSDHEEPAAKVGKFEDSMEELDEGQEEWLSEGILTDDDYQPTADHDSSAMQSQDENVEQPEDSTDVFDSQKTMDTKSNNTELNTDKIEEALDNMEKTDENEDELPGDLGTFLVRKVDGKIIETRDDSEVDSVRHTDEDANDTDELLRMLGDDDQKVKKKKEIRKIVEKKPNDQQSTDEEDVFESVKVTRLKTKKVVFKKTPTKAVPEATSDEDASTKTISRTKGPKNTILKKVVTKALSKDFSDDEEAAKVNRIRVAKQAIATKMAARAVPEDLSDDEHASDDKSTVARMFSARRRGPVAAKSTAGPQGPKTDLNKPRPKSLPKVQKKSVQTQQEPEELINEEEFLEEDAFDEVMKMDEYREDLESVGEGRSKKQPIMRPERMDEEFLSDGDSGSDENSFYDELPSTDSEEDLEDWFTLDIRSERAGDYLPLLGDKAHAVLSEERGRISERVSSLRESLAAVAEGSRAQARQLRRAALRVAELDAHIRAA